MSARIVVKAWKSRPLRFSEGIARKTARAANEFQPRLNVTAHPAADEMRLGLRRAAYGEPDATAFHRLLQAVKG